MTCWIPYDAAHYTVESCKETARRLRSSGKYLKMKLGSYVVENGVKYCKIFVLRKQDAERVP